MESVRQTLAKMRTISLEEMDSCALMNRVDTKYVLSVSQLSDVLESVVGDYQVLSIEGSELLPYENIYFDTPDHLYYLQHHNGRLNRYKCRIRRYVVSDLCFLEVKLKNNKGRTAKQRMVIDQMEQTLSATSKEYLREITGSELDLQPQLWSQFSRITLVAPQQGERATLDLGLTFSHNGDRHEMPNIVIAEVKQPRLNGSSQLRKAFKRHGIRQLRVSKYCLGCTFLKPHLKNNRFKPKLNTLRQIAS